MKEIARAFLVSETAMEQRITRAKRQVSAAERAVRDAGRGRALRARRRGRRDDVSHLQRRLLGDRRLGAYPRDALRRGDPPGAAAAAPVSERARDHGARWRCCSCSMRARRRGSMPTARSCCSRTRIATWDRDMIAEGSHSSTRRCAIAGPVPIRCRRRSLHFMPVPRGPRTRTGRRSTNSTRRSNGCSRRRSSR